MAMSWKVIVVLLIALLAWSYNAFFPPSPLVCGSLHGPPVTAPRIKLRDGRHLAYKEHGVPKDRARYKIIMVHGFLSSRHEDSLTKSELAETLGIYFVSFDRPGYGQSDPDPKRTMKSTALDIEELGDQLGLGPKFFVAGFSMGGLVVWGCLKYIPHRLAGATLIAPVVNYWWPSFPANLSTEAYYQQSRRDQWALRVAHHAPWLLYWWDTQKWFPSSSVANGTPNFTAPDLKVLQELAATRYKFGESLLSFYFILIQGYIAIFGGVGEKNSLPSSMVVYMAYATQQGKFESLHREMMVGFGKWDFDPMNLENPFIDTEGSVHLWQGLEDGLVPHTQQRFIAQKLQWIQYHEVPNAGHLFAYNDANAKDSILNTLLIGKN